jgi:hypothetical protein
MNEINGHKTIVILFSTRICHTAAKSQNFEKTYFSGLKKSWNFLKKFGL